MPQITDEFLTRQDIARLTRSCLPTVDGFIHNQDPDLRLPSFRLGVKVLVRRDDFDAWLERQRLTGKAEVRRTRRRTASV